MAPNIFPNQPKKQNRNNGIISEIVRPQRKRLSRYKLKKQAGLIEQMLDDPQIMGV